MSIGRRAWLTRCGAAMAAATLGPRVAGAQQAQRSLNLTQQAQRSLNLTQQAQRSEGPQAQRSVILVHGAMHGAWCWYKVLPRLRVAGLDATAIDLPGRGRNPLPRNELTREAYLASVLQAIDVARTPVVLVAHDISAVLACLAAQARPEQVARLVFVAAHIPRPGESLLSIAQGDDESLLRGRTQITRDRSMISVRDDALSEVLYADCSEEDLALAQAVLVPEATQPFTAAIDLSASRYGAVPKASIICTQDRALGPKLQRSTSQDAGCDPIIEIQCGHAPFLAAPVELAAALVSLA